MRDSVYLPADVIEQLDVTARGQGHSRDGGRCPGYRFRRPGAGYDWIAEADTAAVVDPDLVRYWHWRGALLDGSLLSHEDKANSQDGVVRK